MIVGHARKRRFFTAHSAFDKRADTAVSRTLAFATYPVGWYYGQGRPADERTVTWALEAIAAFNARGARAIESFLDVSGGIMVSGYSEGGQTIDALIRPDGLVEWDDQTDVPHSELITLNKALQQLRSLKWRTKSSGFYIRNITAQKKSTSSLWHLEILATGVAPQSFLSDASKRVVLECAGTSQDTTPTLPGVLLSSGDSTRRFSRAA